MKKVLGVAAVIGVLGIATLGYAHGPARYGQGWRMQGETPASQYCPRTTGTRGHFGPMSGGQRGQVGRVGPWMMGGQHNRGPHGRLGFGAWAPTQGTTTN